MTIEPSPTTTGTTPLAPLISVIVPCRNERNHIDAFCDSVLQQVLPPGWHMEVLVADGNSDDGTRERLAQRCAADPRLVTIDNPGRIVSSGLNACIAKARGSVIARLDVHSQFAPDYLAQCIHALERTRVDNVGGPWVAAGAGATGLAIAAAFQNRWVVGGALSRNTQYDGEVDTVYLGCWPRSTFDRFGVFDEALVRNQDDEHNLRLRLGGGKIWQSPLIRSTYQPRNSLAHLFAQQRQYGYWRPFVMRKHGQPGSARQLVPALLVAAVGGCAVAAWWSVWPMAALALAYALYLAGATASAARSAHNWRLVARLPAVIAAVHVGYGMGTWRGLWDIARSQAPSSAFAKITR